MTRNFVLTLLVQHTLRQYCGHSLASTCTLKIFWASHFVFSAWLAVAHLSFPNSEHAKGAEKASCRETVVQKGGFGESVSSLPP